MADNETMKQLKGSRILHLPNEAAIDRLHMQMGSRGALQHLTKAGFFSSYESFSFLAHYKQARDARETWRRILEVANEFQPDVIYWQHLAGFPVTEEDLMKLKLLASQPMFIYHESDAFGRFRKPMNASLRRIMRLSDLVIMSGTGAFFNLARSAGAKRLMVAPQPFDTERFGVPWQPTTARRHDLVMIGSSVRSRIPGMSIPGSARRRQLAKDLCVRLGNRFALYGKGWDSIRCSRGYLPYDEQEAAIRSAWVSINWDHFEHIPYYFSDRLSISLAAGVPHVTSYHPGYEQMFRDCEGLFWAKSPAEAIDIADYLISLGRPRLLELGEAAQAFALEHLEANKVYSRLFDAIAARFDATTKGSERPEPLSTEA